MVTQNEEEKPARFQAFIPLQRTFFRGMFSAEGSRQGSSQNPSSFFMRLFDHKADIFRLLVL